MAAPANGPVLGQGIVCWQGAPMPVRFVIPDPRAEMAETTARWWVGPRPVVRTAPPPCIAGSPDAVHRDAITGASDGAGNVVFAFTIEPADLSSFPPGGFYQHELWLIEPGREPYPSSIGPLVIQPTVGGAAS